MSEQRAVVIAMNAVEQMAIQQATDTTEWFKALGYLSTWNMTFPTVTIYSGGSTDMIAVYSDADGNRGYTIGAVWNGERFGFHS